jgi:hypothetical protein
LGPTVVVIVMSEIFTVGDFDESDLHHKNTERSILRIARRFVTHPWQLWRWPGRKTTQKTQCNHMAA